MNSKNLRTFYHIFVLTPIIFAFALGINWDPEDIPLPWADPSNICNGNSRNTTVCDPDNLINIEFRYKIDQVIENISLGKGIYRNATAKCISNNKKVLHYQIYVLIIKNLPKENFIRTIYAKNSYHDPFRRNKRFAKDIFYKWNIEGRPCSSGILFFLEAFKLPRLIIVSEKTKSESYFAPWMIDQAIERSLNTGNFSGAINDAVYYYGMLLAGEKIPEAKYIDDVNFDESILSWMFIIFFLIWIQIVIHFFTPR